ncbi:uncharacterized protein LOC106870819 isoform X2 [Octopus bimaculoides]|nr:uncharacterized protein LOC106870819 isoform X2 [Octopus bimaculoides]
MEIVQLRQSRTFVDTSTPEYIGRIKFPGYFRTEEEQKTWAKLTPGRELVGSVCCQSNVSWTTPIQMEDITGNMRDIAQYQNLKQFYYTSQCKQTTDCDVCTCENEKVLVSLVYQYSSQGGEVQQAVGRFPAVQCCKCVRI